jgi:hypothetical protein
MPKTVPFSQPATIPFGKASTPVQAPQQSLADQIWSGLASYGGAVKNAASQGADQINEGVTAIQNPAGGTPVQGLEAGLKTESGIASVVSSPLAPIFSIVGKLINAIGDHVGNLSAVQKFANSSAGQTTSRVAGDLSDAGNIAGTILGADEAVKGPAQVADTAAKVKDALTPNAPDPDAVAAAANDKETAQLKGVAQDWEAPTTINKPGYNNARVALDKAPGTPQFLAEQGLNPFAHVEDGKFATEDAAQNLRDTAGKMSNDTLRPSLQLADYTVPKTSVADLVQRAIEQAQNTLHITADDMETIVNNIKQKGGALERKYPDGMSLENMHDEKITYAKNGGYNQFRSNADTNAAIGNKSLGSAFADLVEQKAPPELPVHDFNAYLQKYYQAADYLDALNGKLAPVSTAQTIARGLSKFGGAVIARHLAPGIGDLVSSFAGYKIGGALEHAAENLTNPMRDTFLRNLKITNPEAFTKVQSYSKSAPK